MAEEKKDLVKAPETALVATFGEGEQTGMEDVRAADLVPPFLRILQKMSDACDPDKEGYLPDAKPGMFYQSDSKELLDEVLLIPCVYKPSMVERKLLPDGKVDMNSFVAEHPVGSEAGLARTDTGAYLLPNGNCLDDTRTWFCLRVISPNEVVPVIVPMRSTQIKVSKRWFTELHQFKAQGKAGAFRPPMYVHLYKGTSVAEDNEKGSWRSWVLNRVRVLEPGKDDALFNMAKEAHTMFNQWAASTAKPMVEGAGGDQTPF